MGLYVHFPFCARKCAYCDFPSYEGKLGLREAYTAAVSREIRARAECAGHPAAGTVYLGGGTPSLMRPGQILLVLQTLREAFQILEGSEVSCEANPSTVAEAFLEAAVQGGVNRLSVGAQSSETPILQILKRRHGWPDVEKTVRRARAAGIENISLDLMLGIPNQTLRGFEETLDAALALAPKHLSCYALILEEGTPLRHAVEEGSLALPDEEETVAMYDLAVKRLDAAGLRQYEVSSFALEGFECRHNVDTWTRVPYLGFGVAAHSLERSDLRRSNPTGIDGYLRGEPPHYETLEKEEAMFETVMLALRMNRGLCEEAFLQAHGEAFVDRYPQAVRRALEGGFAERRGGFFCLTRRGMDVMNAVLTDFLQEERASARE